MKHLYSIRRALAGVFFTLFVLMTLNNIVFRHAHRLPDGRIITHAHPFKPVGDSPVQSHSHSATELFWLDMLTHGAYVATAAFVFGFLGVIGAFIYRQRPVYASQLPAFPFVLFSHRGPPVAAVSIGQ